MNCAGDSEAIDASNGMTYASSMPARAKAFTRSSSVAIIGGSVPGRKNTDGCSRNVSTAVRSPARRMRSAVRTIARCPR